MFKYFLKTVIFIEILILWSNIHNVSINDNKWLIISNYITFYSKNDLQYTILKNSEKALNNIQNAGTFWLQN